MTMQHLQSDPGGEMVCTASHRGVLRSFSIVIMFPIDDGIFLLNLGPFVRSSY